MLRQQPRPGLLAGLPCRTTPLGGSFTHPLSAPYHRHSRTLQPCMAAAASSPDNNSSSSSGIDQGKSKQAPKSKGFGPHRSSRSAAARSRQQRQALQPPQQQRNRSSQGFMAASSSSSNSSSSDGGGRSQEDNAPSRAQPSMHDSPDPQPSAVPESPPGAPQASAPVNPTAPNSGPSGPLKPSQPPGPPVSGPTETVPGWCGS
jgi:hypothetical protein